MYSRQLMFLTPLLLLLASTPDARAAAPDVPMRAGRQYFEVRQADGSYKPVYVKGMNLSVALPGHHPSEFPARRAGVPRLAGQIARDELQHRPAVHDPAAGDVQARFSGTTRRTRSTPLWLIQGVWVEPPPEHDFLDQAYHGRSADEHPQRREPGARQRAVRRAPGLDRRQVHRGRLAVAAGLAARAASGSRTTSRASSSCTRSYTSYKGHSVSCPQGQPIECWFARSATTA